MVYIIFRPFVAMGSQRCRISRQRPLGAPNPSKSKAKRKPGRTCDRFQMAKQLEKNDGRNRFSSDSSWWLNQPIWKTSVKLDHEPSCRGQAPSFFLQGRFIIPDFNSNESQMLHVWNIYLDLLNETIFEPM